MPVKRLEANVMSGQSQPQVSPSHLEDGGKAGVCLVANLSIHSFQLTGCRLTV